MRLAKLFIAISFLSGCASVPYAAGMRRAGASSLQNCIKNDRNVNRREACLHRSQVWCLNQGLEVNCAVDGMW